MVQILKNPYNEIGRNLGTGLQALAQYKIGQLQEQQQRQRTAQGIRALVPQLTEQQATAFAGQSPEIQKQYLKDIIERPQREALARGLFNGGSNSQGAFNSSAQSNDIPLQLNSKDALALANYQQGQRKEERNKAKDVNDYLKPYIEQDKKNENNIRTYELLQKQVKTGKVRTGTWAQALNAMGIQDVGRNYETQIAQKLIAQLAQNIAGVFGSNARVTNFLEQTFQRSLPSLWNTPEGINAISELNLLGLRAQRAEQKIREQVLKENNYNLTPGVELEIRNRSKPILDELESATLAKIQSGAKFTRSISDNNKNFSGPSKENASQYDGKKIKNPETGEILISNGTDWVPVQENQ